MKFLYSIVFVLALGAVVFTGCGAPKSSVHKASEQADEFRDAPAWVIESQGAGKDSMSAVGSAKIGKAGVGFARTEAMALARSELARIISVQVRDMVKNFTQQIELGDDQAVDRLASQTSRQVARQSLSGSMQKAFWISPGSILYVLVGIDSENVSGLIRESIKASIANERALWQQNQAGKSFMELNNEVDETFGN